MRTTAAASTGPVQRTSTGVGWVSLGPGVAMTLSPRRSAALLGWTGRESLTRLVRAVDLILGSGLLLARRRAPWMLARALLNAAICLVYVRILEEGHPRSRGAGAGLMAALAVSDCSLSRRLWVAEAT